VSVGMLFDPRILVEEPLRVLLVVAIIVVGKSLAAAALVLAMRYPLGTALNVSASLAQIGEFSFILAGLGMTLGLLPPQGHSLVLAGALISIALNPLLFSAIGPMQDWLQRRSRLARSLAQRDDPLAQLPMTTEARFLANQVVLVGYGRVGREVAQALRAAGRPFVVADANRERVDDLRREGQAAVFGDAAEPDTLIQAHIAQARLLVITPADTLAARRMIETSRTLNPSVEVVVACPNPDEAQRLADDEQVTALAPQTELARAMTAVAMRALDD